VLKRGGRDDVGGLYASQRQYSDIIDRHRRFAGQLGDVGYLEKKKWEQISLGMLE